MCTVFAYKRAPIIYARHTRPYGLYYFDFLYDMSVFLNSLQFSVNCTAGFYRNSSVTSCTECEVLNTISTAGASSCTACVAGTEANEDRTECGEQK